MDAGTDQALEQPFSIAAQPREDALLLVVTGELDLAAAPEFTEVVERAVAGTADEVPVLLDLSAVTYLDSSGFRALVDLRAALDARLRLLRPSAPVLRLLELTVTTGQFTIVDAG